jgi:hypothetical protein
MAAAVALKLRLVRMVVAAPAAPESSSFAINVLRSKEADHEFCNH